MKKHHSIDSPHSALLPGLLLVLLSVTGALAAGNIDATNKWAWGTNAGWINFSPDTVGGVTVYTDHLEGWAWAENIGWIRMGAYEAGGTHSYANSSGADYGINKDGIGVLSGYAWATNAGWINFSPSGGGVTINPATGEFDGYAWGENIGWIRFNGGAYSVVTDWRAFHTLTYAPGANGSIIGATSQTIAHGESGSTVTATPNVGYHFVKWSDNVLTAARTDTIVTADISVTAEFAVNTYTLTYTAAANGAITGVTPQTVNHGGSGSTVTAAPDAGYHFVKWSDNVPTAGRTDTNVTADITVSAEFAVNTYTLTYLAGANGSITGATPQTISHGGSGTAVTAAPDAGYLFVKWSDNVLSPTRTDINVTSDITVAAEFAMVLTAVATTNPTSITATSVTLGGNVTGVVAVTSRGICWNATGNPSLADTVIPSGSGLGSFTVQITGLAPNATYHARAWAINSLGTTYYGDPITFTTRPVLPVVATGPVTAITSTGATASGTVQLDSGALTARGICWSADPAIHHSLWPRLYAGNTTGVFTKTLTGLTPGTPYHVRAYATIQSANNITYVVFGEMASFTTVILPGDVNGDNQVNLIDAVLALKIISRVDTGGAAIRLGADVNGDHRIGPEEALFILQKEAGQR